MGPTISKQPLPGMILVYPHLPLKQLMVDNQPSKLGKRSNQANNSSLEPMFLAISHCAKKHRLLKLLEIKKHLSANRLCQSKASQQFQFK